MKVNIVGGEIQINIYDLIHGLPDEEKSKILELFVFNEIIPAIERQLKHETDCWSYGNGDGDGSALRAEILKIQGIEPEFKKDLETKIRSLQGEVSHYKKYYDWYYRIYHADCRDDQVSLLDQIRKRIGDV